MDAVGLRYDDPFSADIDDPVFHEVVWREVVTRGNVVDDLFDIRILLEAELCLYGYKRGILGMVIFKCSNFIPFVGADIGPLGLADREDDQVPRHSLKLAEEELDEWRHWVIERRGCVHGEDEKIS